MSFYIILALVFGAVTVVAVQNPYDQCGGMNWTGGTTCTAGWTCQYQNPYYSQCLPAPSATSTAGTTPSSSTTANTAVQTPYGQCGGINWTGGTTCTAGWTCQYQNPYYSQCLQAPVSSGTNQNPSTATTTTKSTSSNTAVQNPYDQCGGINWTGGTTCTAGWTCQYQNSYYSQCLPAPSTSSSLSTTRVLSSTSSTSKTLTTSTTTPLASSKSSSTTTVTTTTKASTTTSSTSSALSTTSTTTPKSSSSTTASGSSPTYKASITHYGAGDSFGSPNCNTNTAACGFYTYPGYSAAISQNFYGAGPGDGAGPACGTCWRVTGQTDSSGNQLSNAGTSIVVMINNLCPAQGNPLCAQNGKSGTNQYGANVNFDLCSDSGAQAAFFGNDGVGLALGTAVQVDCSMWSGTVVH